MEDFAEAMTDWHVLSLPGVEGCAKCRPEANSCISALAALHPLVTET